MRASVVINRRSSRSNRQLSRLPPLFAAHGIDVDALYVAEDEIAVRKRLRKIVKSGAKLVIVGGGDGTMTTAADVMAHRDTVLGVLPLGTGNSFALTLGISNNLDAALDVIVTGRVVPVDLGIVNGTYFANFATIGLSAEIADAAPHLLKRFIGSAAYAVGGIKPFFEHGPFHARVKWDDGKTAMLTQQMVIANGRFFGRQPVTPNASIVDARLDFFSTTGVSRLDMVRTYLAFGLGVQTKLPDAVVFSSREIVVKASPKQLVSIDGNTLGTTPARFGIARGALRVCVPAEFHDARA